METTHASLTGTLSETASDLQRKLDLLQQWQRRPLPAPSLRSDPASFSGGQPRSREEMLQLAIQGVIRHAGIQPTESLRGKLDRLFNDPAEQPFLHRLTSGASGQEDWQKLVERVTVHETYFYRDRPQMEMIRKEIIAPLVRERQTLARPTLRFWSAACSTGEEAYTLAILTVMELLARREATLLPQGEVQIAPRWSVEIIGSDISHRALEIARQGRYLQQGSLSPFREMPPEMRRFLHFTGEGQECSGQVRESIRRLVAFRHHNLTTGAPHPEEVELLLCRNVMIYFDEPTRMQVQERLRQSLRPGGFLVLGPSDTLLLSSGFKTRWGDKSVLHQKE